MCIQMLVILILIFIILISYLMILKRIFYPGSDNLLTILSQVLRRKSGFVSGSMGDFSIRPGDQGQRAVVFPRKNLFPRFLHPLFCDIVANIRDIGVPRGLREFPVAIGVFEIEVCSFTLISQLISSFDTISPLFFTMK